MVGVAATRLPKDNHMYSTDLSRLYRVLGAHKDPGGPGCERQPSFSKQAPPRPCAQQQYSVRCSSDREQPAAQAQLASFVCCTVRTHHLLKKFSFFRFHSVLPPGLMF
jgi:hypothetical protein